MQSILEINIPERPQKKKGTNFESALDGCPTCYCLESSFLSLLFSFRRT